MGFETMRRTGSKYVRESERENEGNYLSHGSRSGYSSNKN